MSENRSSFKTGSYPCILYILLESYISLMEFSVHVDGFLRCIL